MYQFNLYGFQAKNVSQLALTFPSLDKAQEHLRNLITGHEGGISYFEEQLKEMDLSINYLIGDEANRQKIKILKKKIRKYKRRIEKYKIADIVPFGT